MIELDRSAGEIAAERAMAAREARVIERIERIVAATLDALTEVGVGITLEEVVKRAGVSRRGVHTLFESFDDLLLAAFDEAAQGRLERQREVFAAHAGDPIGQLAETLRVRWTWFDGEPVHLSRARAVLYPTLRPRRSRDHEVSRWTAASAFAPAVAELRRAEMLRSPALDDVELVDAINQYVKGRLTDRVLAVAPEVASLPADPAGFDHVWRVVRALVLAD
ncbi:MAG: TetR/AcrR family transcriptional regulator [Desertimonas sp.]